GDDFVHGPLLHAHQRWHAGVPARWPDRSANRFRRHPEHWRVAEVEDGFRFGVRCDGFAHPPSRFQRNDIHRKRELVPVLLTLTRIESVRSRIALRCAVLRHSREGCPCFATQKSYAPGNVGQSVFTCSGAAGTEAAALDSSVASWSWQNC